MELPPLPSAKPSAHALRCPQCLYDLSNAVGSSGGEITCPECGNTLNIRVQTTRTAATVSLALAMVGWGALAVAAAEIVGVAIGSSVSPLLEPQNRVLRGETIALPLQFLPQIIVASGAGVLGWVASRTTRQRRWSVGVTGAFVLSLLYAKTSAGGISNLDALGGWWQPEFWNSANLWILGITTWLTVWTAAQAVCGTVLPSHSRIWRRIALMLCVVAGIGLCLTLLLRFTSSIFPMPALYRAAQQTRNEDTLRLLGGVRRHIETVLHMAWWMAWIGTALAAFFARSLLRVERQQTGHREPQR